MNTSTPKNLSMTIVNEILSVLTLERLQNTESICDESKQETSDDDYDIIKDEIENSKIEEPVRKSPNLHLKKGQSMSIRPEKLKSKNLAEAGDDYIEANTPSSGTIRSRTSGKGAETRNLKRPQSSYGTTKQYSNRMGSTSSSRQKLHSKGAASTVGNLKELGHHSYRYTPQSKERREDNIHSFVAPETPGSLLKLNKSNKTGNSVTGEVQVAQIDEEEEKKLILENPMRKRVFLHVAQTSTSVQVAWSHANKSKSGKRVQYMLEYGVGIKMNGKEQFRMIYKGKAHKCIITDLMPRTAYRFKVVPFKIDDDGKEVLGE